MNLVQVNLKDLIHPDYNPRKISEKEKQGINASLNKFGQVENLIINMYPGRENIIISGNQRVEVMLQRGKKTAFAVIENLNKQDEQEMCLALNNGGHYDTDKAQLYYTMEEIDTYGIGAHLDLDFETDFDDMNQEPPQETKAILTFDEPDDLDLAKADLELILKKYSVRMIFK